LAKACDEERAVIALGIDPGSVSAAWGLLGPGVCLTDDVPIVGKMINAAGLADMVAGSGADVVIVEKVGSFPKQGVSSSFNFGKGVGIITGCIAALGFKMVEVSPGTWKRHFHLGPEKEDARALALKMFPGVAKNLSRKKDVGRAEALLMAAWYLETYSK
jgi:crossover junction endodeoxyribonuclease RuvC